MNRGREFLDSLYYLPDQFRYQSHREMKGALLPGRFFEILSKETKQGLIDMTSSDHLNVAPWALKLLVE